MTLHELAGAQPVLLEEMLAARERRVMQQQELLRRHGKPLVCFTLNIAGPYKQFPLAQRTFEEGVRLISRRLGEPAIHLKFQENTGSTAFFVVDSEADAVKTRMMSLEDSLSIGRLFDIDVLDPSGAKRSREDMGHSGRRCLLCDRPAAECGRARSHSVEELQQVTVRMMREYFDRSFADEMAEAAVRALLSEVATTPKPGLVDRLGNGAHRDMDFFTFINSTAALIPYFREATLEGLRGKGDSKALFHVVRCHGQLAEEEMLRATGGVNTHKGLIFSVGILCAAAGALRGREGREDLDSLLDAAGQLAACALGDLDGVTARNAQSHGERIFARHGVGGIRREAADGFPHVRQYALPVLKESLEAGHPLNDAGAAALLNLLAQVYDTNIIHRAGLEALEDIQARAGAFLQKAPTVEEQKVFLAELDEEFVCRNISAGGCADLLAVAYLLYLYEKLVCCSKLP